MSTETKIKEYFEKFAERFDGFYKNTDLNFFQKLVHLFLRKPGLICRFQTTIKILKNVENKNILDVGCGSGVYSIYLAKKGANVNGIDFSNNMVKISEENAKKENSSCKFTLIDFLNYQNEIPFNTILFIGFFDYVKKNQLIKYFKKATGLCSDNIIATFPKKISIQTIIRFLWLKKQKCSVYFYTKKQINRLAKKFRFQTIFYNCGPIWTVEFKKY